MMWLNWLQAGEAHKQEMVGELKIGGFQLPQLLDVLRDRVLNFSTGEIRPLLQRHSLSSIFFPHYCVHSWKSAISLSLKNIAIPTKARS